MAILTASLHVHCTCRLVFYLSHFALNIGKILQLYGLSIIPMIGIVICKLLFCIRDNWLQKNNVICKPFPLSYNVHVTNVINSNRLSGNSKTYSLTTYLGELLTFVKGRIST